MALLLCFAAFMGCGLLYLVFLNYFSDMPKVEEATTPLEDQVVQDLCNRLDMTGYEHLCMPGAVVYAPDFSRAVKQSFTPGITTYDDVQEELGRYLDECRDPITSQDGKTTFECLYDFRGDNHFMAQFEFTDDMILDTLNMSSGFLPHPY